MAVDLPRNPGSPAPTGHRLTSSPRKQSFFTQTLWDGSCFLIPENHPWHGAISFWVLLPALIGLASAPQIKLLSGSRAGFVGRSGLRDPCSHPSSLGSTEGIPCSVLVALPQLLPQPCHRHMVTRGKKRVTMHPAGLWLGHQATSEVLLLGYPAAKGPKEATGELLAPGKCSWESRGCRWMSQHGPGMSPRWLWSPEPALTQPWHRPSPEPELFSAIRCHL